VVTTVERRLVRVVSGIHYGTRAGQNGQWYPLWNAGWSEWSVVSTVERGLVRMVSGIHCGTRAGQIGQWSGRAAGHWPGGGSRRPSDHSRSPACQVRLPIRACWGCNTRQSGVGLGYTVGVSISCTINESVNITQIIKLSKKVL